MPQSIPAAALRTVYHLVTLFRPDGAAAYGAAPHTQVFDGAGTQPAPLPEPPTIPDVIWTYWNEEPIDPLVQQCITSWRTHCKGFQIRVLSTRNVGDFVAAADLPAGFASLHPTKQSDWLRLYVVGRYGGYWLDASTLLTRPLKWMEAQRQTSGAQFTGFYLEGFTKDPKHPVVESWAFGAPAGSAFVRAWQSEFHHALVGVGTQAYLADLRRQSDGAAILQDIADPEYLLIHVAAQRVLQRPNHFRLALFKAEDTAYFYQKALRWKWYLLYTRLCLVRAESAPAPLIKLRGGERRHFAQMFVHHGKPAPGTVWHRACTSLPGADTE